MTFEIERRMLMMLTGLKGAPYLYVISLRKSSR